MSGFHEVSLPLAWALGARGGPERRTDIVVLGSGRETRNAPRSHARRRYEIGGGVQSRAALAELSAFFEARRGQLYGFRFRDALDWTSHPASAQPGPLDQALGLGDGATVTFQLIKRYGAGEAAYDRPICKPVAGSVRIAVDGEETSAFAVDPVTGLVTFSAAPASAAVLTAGFAFDTPVRFDAPRLELSLDSGGAGRVLSVPLIELLL